MYVFGECLTVYVRESRDQMHVKERDEWNNSNCM